MCAGGILRAPQHDQQGLYSSAAEPVGWVSSSCSACLVGLALLFVFPCLSAETCASIDSDEVVNCGAVWSENTARNILVSIRKCSPLTCLNSSRSRWSASLPRFNSSISSLWMVICCSSSRLIFCSSAAVVCCRSNICFCTCDTVGSFDFVPCSAPLSTVAALLCCSCETGEGALLCGCLRSQGTDRVDAFFVDAA